MRIELKSKRRLILLIGDSEARNAKTLAVVQFALDSRLVAATLAKCTTTRNQLVKRGKVVNLTACREPC
jgi:hypothetical protein